MVDHSPRTARISLKTSADHKLLPSNRVAPCYCDIGQANGGSALCIPSAFKMRRKKRINAKWRIPQSNRSPEKNVAGEALAMPRERAGAEPYAPKLDYQAKPIRSVFFQQERNTKPEFRRQFWCGPLNRRNLGSISAQPRCNTMQHKSEKSARCSTRTRQCPPPTVGAAVPKCQFIDFKGKIGFDRTKSRPIQRRLRCTKKPNPAQSRTTRPPSRLPRTQP